MVLEPPVHGQQQSCPSSARVHSEVATGLAATEDIDNDRSLEREHPTLRQWRYGIIGRRGEILPLKVKPYVVKYEFQNSLMYMYCVPPLPEARNRAFALPRMRYSEIKLSLP